MKRDMIQYSMTWHDVEKNSITFSCESQSCGTHEYIESWIHLKTQFRIEIQMKYILKQNLCENSIMFC